MEPRLLAVALLSLQAAAATATPVVGVVLDLANGGAGRKSLSRLSMALDVKHPSLGLASRADSVEADHAESNRRRKLLGRNSGTVCSGKTNKKPLKIGVPKKDGFKAFVNVSHPYVSCEDNGSRPNTATKQITGYSIDVFETAMQQLKHPPCYEFCVFDGPYDELVGNVSLGKLDGAAGDVTITTARIGEVDFTMPYTWSGVSLLVLSRSRPTIQWNFLEPMTKELWFATAGFIFFVGFAVLLIERPRNPEYQGSLLRQSSTAMYFAFSTLTFSHAHNIRSPLTRIVVVIWCLVVLVLVQSYTASFSSILTAKRLHPTTNLDQLLLSSDDKIGYQKGSFVYPMLRSRGFSNSRLLPYSTEDEYAQALEMGSKKGGVSAIVDEVPYLISFLSDNRYQNKFQILDDHIYKTPGFGFVFNIDSCPLAHDLSTAILNITGGNEGSKIEEKWLGTAAAPRTVTETASAALTLGNFSGLFLISGLMSSLMLLISIVQLVHARWTAARHNARTNIDIVTPSDEESRPLQQIATGNVSAQDQPHPEAKTTDGDCQGAHGSGGTVGAEASRLTLNDVGNSSVRDEIPNEEMSSETLQGAHHRSSGSARYDETSEVRNGSVPGQPFEIEIKIG